MVFMSCQKVYPTESAIEMPIQIGLALHSAGQNQAALVKLLDIILNAPDLLKAYHRSRRYYTDKLRTT